MNNQINNLRAFGKFRLDAEKRVLWFEEKPLDLPLKAIELLCVLVAKHGELVTKDELLQKVWANSFVEESNLSRLIYLLRKTFKDFGENDLIENVPRRGYRFTGEVRDFGEREIVIKRHTETKTLVEVEEDEDDRETRPAVPPRTSSSASPLSFPALALSLVLLGGIAFYAYQGWRTPGSAAPIKSIAVLPFRTIDADRLIEQDGLGLTDILITRLSNIREITVRPTRAVLNFNDEDPLGAGRKLEVDAVLEGTIYRTGDKVRVSARLVKVSDGTAAWSGHFEKLKTDELRLQHEIALQVTDALALNLSDAEKDALTKNYTQNAEAFELYQKGRFEWNKRGSASIAESERLFRNAIARDPDFALAYAGLADTLVYGGSPEAFSVLEKALEIDPNLAEAHASLGFVQTFRERNWQAAEKSFRKSIELNPNYAIAHHWYAQVLSVQGRFEEAKAEMRKALEINPHSHNFLADLGQIYYFNREYREAEEYCRRALEIYPGFVFAHQYLTDIYLMTGKNDAAIEQHIAASRSLGTYDNQSSKWQKEMEKDFAETRRIYAEGGIEKFIEKLTRHSADTGMTYYNARFLSLIGEKEKALEQLERSLSSGVFHSVFVKADPIFDKLRDEPRYREVLRKMYLE